MVRQLDSEGYKKTLKRKLFKVFLLPYIVKKAQRIPFTLPHREVYLTNSNRLLSRISSDELPIITSKVPGSETHCNCSL